MWCEGCEEDVEHCEQCEKEFQVGDNVICDGTDATHYCSKECLVESYLGLSDVTIEEVKADENYEEEDEPVEEEVEEEVVEEEPEEEVVVYQPRHKKKRSMVR